MKPKLAQNLAGKSVMSSSGETIGKVFNVTLDLRTGELNHLLVTPQKDTPTANRLNYSQDDYGRYEVLVDSVESVGDYVIVN